MYAPVYVNMNQDIHYGHERNKITQDEYLEKYGKFLNSLQGHFINQIPLISEEYSILICREANISIDALFR